MSWLDRILGRRPAQTTGSEADRRAPNDAGQPEEAEECEPPEPEAVVVPIEDSIDLHPFSPREIRDVVRGYLDEAWERGFEEVRIIHGRGIGQQRRAVRTLLERDPRIASFADAGVERGGWGATVARFVARDAPVARRPGEPGPGAS